MHETKAEIAAKERERLAAQERERLANQPPVVDERTPERAELEKRLAAAEEGAGGKIQEALNLLQEVADDYKELAGADEATTGISAGRATAARDILDHPHMRNALESLRFLRMHFSEHAASGAPVDDKGMGGTGKEHDREQFVPGQQLGTRAATQRHEAEAQAAEAEKNPKP